MHHFLKQYHPYIVDRHAKTLLPQYLALYRLTVDSVESYMVVIRNVFSAHLKVHKKYDLKGSRVDREASDKEREKSCPTLKDNDFLADGVKISIGEEGKEALMETLGADVDFLSKLNITGYSLLVGIHDMDRALEDALEAGAEEEEDEEEYDSTGSGAMALTPPESPNTRRKASPSSLLVSQTSRIDPNLDIYAIPSRAGTVSGQQHIYFLSIMDVLTHYGIKKAAAKAAKTVKYGSEVDGISTAEPDQYSRRFLAFVNDAIE